MSVTQASLLGDTFGSQASGTIPVGGIIMWSGSTASIPTGWALCNGANGTPNLLDRFIVGAGSGYSVAATGGSADAVVVSHSHTITEPNGGLGHRHNISEINGQTGLNGSGNDFTNDGATLSNPVETDFATTGITINYEGVSGTNKNLPPYYALAFIMRVS